MRRHSTEHNNSRTVRMRAPADAGARIRSLTAVCHTDIIERHMSGFNSTPLISPQGLFLLTGMFGCEKDPEHQRTC